jgi:DedD protein
MDDRGLRDIERWRDKIEVRLDNRQVFFLFFGSALVACMLFVLGVIVGKRLESRGRAVSPEIEDPLALLDKVATTPRPAPGGVTFPQALLAPGAGKPGRKAAAPALEGEPELIKPEKPAARESKPSETASRTTVVESKPAKTESKPVAAAEDKQPSPAPKAKSDDRKSAAPVQAEAKATPKAAQDEKPAEAKPAKEDKPVAIPTIASGSDSKSKGRFTLQLSSFQDKAEAEAFAQKFTSERPYLVVSEIPGKGTWYRVRVGDYPSAKDAVAAKDSFEKKHNVIAYVAQR